MEKILLRFFWILLFFLLISFWITFWLDFVNDSWNDKNPVSWLSDSWNINTRDNNSIWVVLLDKNSNDYINLNKRAIISEYNNSWSWFIISEQYWDFFIKWAWTWFSKWGDILLYKDNSNSSCSWSWNLLYSFSWTLNSEEWWDLEIDKNNSYLCPSTWDYQIELNSLSWWIWWVKFSWNVNEVPWPLSVIDSRWNNTNVNLSDLYSNKKLSVNWIISSNNIDSLNDNEFWNNNWNKLEYEWWKLEVSKIIKQNLVKYTKWITAIMTNIDNLAWFSEKIHYYNFEWQEESNASNLWNKWKILEISNWWWIWLNYNRNVITNHKLLYVKWWNIYINSDIYNASDVSQLVIVATRDSNNMKNWWNIYIDPRVTNIDAILISDWSILSYNWNKVLSTINPGDINSLRNQLLIYWATSTKNTLWKDESIYWTDDYIKDWWISKNTWLYNLWNLRSFQVIPSEQIEDWVCNNIWNITARGDSWTWSLQYAFAWKKKCYITDSINNWLRSTDKTAWVVIEYNPILQTNPHFILKK